MIRGAAGRALAVPALAVIGGLAAVLALARTPEASARRPVYDTSGFGHYGADSVYQPPPVPRFEAMALPATSRAAAESLARRLGLTGSWDRDLYVCDLASGFLVWAAGPRSRSSVRIPPGRVAPLAQRDFEPDDPGLPMGRWAPLPTLYLSPPENRVAQLTGPIALVHSVDEVAGRWPPPRALRPEPDRVTPIHGIDPPGVEDVPLIPFGDWIELPELGARARRGDAGPCTVLMMEPSNQVGFTARWLKERGPGWIGFELEVPSLESTREAFARRGIRTRRLSDRAVWLPPSEGGGALVMFTTRALGRPYR